MEESNIASLNADGKGGCAQLSVNEDQVPVVGQQTEVGEESGCDGEEDVVSSLTGCKSESCITGSEISSPGQKVDDGRATGTYLYAHSTANAETQGSSPDRVMHPDSVQQEEAVTTSSESTITLPAHKCGGYVTDPVNDKAVDVIKPETVRNLVNYDSSDSDESSVKTPRIENLDEENVFQFPDSNSQSLETGETKDENDPSVEIDGSNKQSETCEQSQEDGKNNDSNGYWNSEGYWVDSQGRVWEPQGHDTYWQGQQWNQEQGGHGEAWQGYGGQEQHWQGQGGEEMQPKQAIEQSWSGEGAQGEIQQNHESYSKGATGDGSVSSGDQYSSHEYYQQEYEEQHQHYASNTANSGQQQYYDHTAYYGQEGYGSGDNQINPGTSKSDVNTSQRSHVYSGTSGQPGEPSLQQSTYPQPPDHTHLQTQSNSSQEGQTQYRNYQARLQEQPDQEKYYCSQPDPAQSWDHRQQHVQQYGHQQEHTSRQHGPYNHGAQHHGEQFLYNEQQSQSGDHAQPVGQQDLYHSQAYGPHEQAKYGQQQHMHPYNQQERDWNNQQWSAGHNKSWQDNQCGSGGWDLNRSRGSNDGSHYQSFEHAPQQQSTNKQEQCYDHHQYYGDHHNNYNHAAPVIPPSSAYIPPTQPSHHISPNHPPPLPPHPPPNIPPPPAHPHPPPSTMQPDLPPQPPSHMPNSLPPPLPTQPPHSFPPPHSHSPYALPPPPHTPSPQSIPHTPTPHSQQSYRNTGDYMQLPSSPSSWQCSRDTDRRKWRYRRDAPQIRGTHQRTSSPPASSDVSSTSRESPTRVQQSTRVANTPETSENVRSPTKTVFSQQLSDPRRTSPPASLKDRPCSKHNNSASTLVQKRTTPLQQQPETLPSSSASCSQAESRHVKIAAKSGKVTKNKASSGEPVSFPKSCLSGFRIPKHSKASHVKKLQNESDGCTTAMDTSPQTKKTHLQNQASKRNKVDSATVGSVEKEEQAINSQNENIEDSDITSKLPDHELKSTIPQETDDDSTKSAVVQDVTNPQLAEESSTDASQLISLFKSIDSNTLCALASTIKLALGSSTSQHLAVDDKVPSPSTTTTVETIKYDNTAATKQPTSPIDMEVHESAPGTGMIHTTSACVTAQESTNDEEAVPTGTSSTVVDVANETGNTGQLQDAAEGSKACLAVKPSQANPRAGTPRMVIATVLSTSAAAPSQPSATIATPSHSQVSIATPSLPEASTAAPSQPETSAATTSELQASKQAFHSKRDGALTVCIPIRKEVKLQVKTDTDISTQPKQTEEIEGPGSEVVPSNVALDPTDLERRDTEQQMEKDESTENTESVDVKTPTISLLKAQDLMFDPKYMYKEYNLRRVRKLESSPEQSPQKRQKLDKPHTAVASLPGNDKVKDKGKPDGESVLSLLTTDEAKRKASAECEEQNEGIPEPKKPRTDTIQTSVEDNVVLHMTKKSDDRTVKKRLNFSVSIPRVQRPSSLAQPPITLTQLLSTPKGVEDKQPPNMPDGKAHVAQDPSKDKVKKKVPTKLSPDTDGVLGSRPLSKSRSQLMCSLCKQKGGVSCLGFLFGPYFYHCEAESSSDSHINTSSDSVEVWLHEDCCVWAPGVCLVGREVKGLKEALTDANTMICTVCKRAGATLCCASRGCKNIYHFPCAMEKGCVLNEDQFQTNCPKHTCAA